MTAPSPDWRQWDSFFTFIVKRLDQDVSGELRSSLGEAFLDSRYELTHTWSRLGGGQNPVPQLFVNAWRRLVADHEQGGRRDNRDPSWECCR